MKSVRIFLAAIVMAAAPYCASAQGSSERIAIGREQIAFPVPVTYVSTTSIPVLRRMAEAATQDTHRLLFALYPAEDVEAWRSGKPLRGERYFLVQTEKQGEAQLLSHADFSSLKLALKQRVASRVVSNDAAARKQQSDAQRQADSNIPELLRELSLPPMTMKIGETTILGIADEQSASISTASATKVSVVSGGQPKEAVLVSVSTVLLVKGKLVNIYGYSSYTGTEDLRWLKNESKALVNQFVAANRG